MRVPSHPTLIRRMLDRRLKQLAPTGPVLAASLVLLNKRCGQPSCRCHHGGPLHQAHHLTFKEEGKTHTAYVPQDLLDGGPNMDSKNTNAQGSAPRGQPVEPGPGPRPRAHRKRKKGRP